MQKGSLDHSLSIGVNIKRVEMKDKHLPINWITIKLENIAQIQSGGTPSRSVSSYWGGNVPWIKISDIRIDILKKQKNILQKKV